MNLMNKMRLYGKQVKYICCDNAGENEKYIQEIADQEAILMEWTSTETPQFNGVAEQKITALKLRGLAMMNAANLNQSTQNLLWPEAIQYANTMYNITSNAVTTNIPYTMFVGR